jgi:hypothetical protein
LDYLNVFGSSFNITQVPDGPNAEQIGIFRVAAVPEPSAWAFLLFGFGAIGAALRRYRRALAIGICAAPPRSSGLGA